MDANASVGADTIQFNIPGAGPFLIQPTTPLPAIIDDGTTIDGFSQPGASPNTLDVGNNSVEKSRGPDELVLDGETWVLRFAGRYGWKNGWRVGLQVPVVSHQGGGMDSFIEEYHDALGLPNGNRKRRPADRLEYRYRRGGETLFSQTDSATGLGDVRLAAGAPLQVSFGSSTGRLYQLEATTNLGDAAGWAGVLPPAVGSGAATSFPAPADPRGQAYRIRAQPR